MREVRIVDTTLRDGEQSPGVALKPSEKIEIAKALSAAGIYQIEAGTPAMGGQEQRTIAEIVGLGLKSKISVWNRMRLDDIKMSIACRPDIIHICVPASDIHMKHKFNRGRLWVLENAQRCVAYAKEQGFEVAVGLEDASRAEMGFLKLLTETVRKEGADRIRYADTVGILHRRKTYEDLKELIQHTGLPFEMHAHNDLGMAVSNSVAAICAGAQYVDTTIAGIGERAGNCNFSELVLSVKAQFGLFGGYNAYRLWKLEARILKKLKIGSRELYKYRA